MSFIPASSNMKVTTRPLITNPATRIDLLAGGILELPPFLLRALQERDDCHGVAMTESELLLQRGNDGARLHTVGQSRPGREALVPSPLAELIRALARLSLDVVEV